MHSQQNAKVFFISTQLSDVAQENKDIPDVTINECKAVDSTSNFLIVMPEFCPNLKNITQGASVIKSHMETSILYK